MNKINRYILFLLLPLIYFMSSYILKSAQGPYYLNFYDPGYVYLISSLNIAQGTGVGHFDHPGTTVQMIGSVIMRIYFSFTGKNPDIAVDVLSRPEDYMYVLNTVFIFINAAVLFLLGVLTYKFSKNIYLSLLIQLSPFTSMEIFYGSVIVSPDNFIITVSLLFLSALMFYRFNFNTEETANNPQFLKLILVFAVICGLGLATKLNFIPLVFIPFFLINGYKNKMYFWIFTVISFLIFIIPILLDIGQFAVWIENLIMKSGKYGKGDSDVVNTYLLLPNLKMIFSKDGVFTFSYLMLIITFIVSIALYLKEKSSGIKYFTKINKIMVSLLFAVTLQILLVAKHYAQYYLIPSMMLSIFVLIVCIYVLMPLFEKAYKKVIPEYLFAVVFIFISVWTCVRIIESYNEALISKNEALASVKFLEENYPDDLLIPAFSSANRECALAFAVRYAAEKKKDYEKIISEKNRSQIFYDPWDNRFYKSSDRDKLKDDLLSLNDKKEKIILDMYYGSPEKFVNKLNEVCEVNNSTFKEVFSNGNGERIYEVTIGN
ncbi:MAG TPA: hypothetical protein PKC58_15830 [Ignavibacteria bacterium]|nr:hypothetical protein [Ignavibacteria bacterium]